MALVSLFFQTSAKIAQLDLDVSINETHKASAKLTQIETEEAETITDNIVLDPLSLMIEGLVSRTPLGKSALVNSVATAAGGLVGSNIGLNTGVGLAAVAGVGAGIGALVSNAFGFDDTGAGKSRKPGDIYDYLLELRNRRTTFEIITALKKYDDMVLTSVEAPRNSSNTGGLRFTATFEQIKIVKANFVDVTLSSLGGQAADKSKLGKQGAKAASQKVVDDSSLLLKLGKYAGAIQ